MTSPTPASVPAFIYRDAPASRAWEGGTVKAPPFKETEFHPPSRRCPTGHRGHGRRGGLCVGCTGRGRSPVVGRTMGLPFHDRRDARAVGWSVGSAPPRAHGPHRGPGRPSQGGGSAPKASMAHTPGPYGQQPCTRGGRTAGPGGIITRAPSACPVRNPRRPTTHIGGRQPPPCATAPAEDLQPSPQCQPRSERWRHDPRSPGKPYAPPPAPRVYAPPRARKRQDGRYGKFPDRGLNFGSFLASRWKGSEVRA